MTDQAAIKEMRSKLPTVLLTMAITLILALFAYQLWLSYRDQIRAAENNTRNLVEIFEARLGGTLRRVDADLQALALEIPPPGDTTTLCFTLCCRLAVESGQPLVQRAGHGWLSHS